MLLKEAKYNMGLDLISISSPTAGMVLPIARDSKISWYYQKGSTAVLCSLSIDGGAHYSKLSLTANPVSQIAPGDNSCTWSIPSSQTTSANCVIKIVDVNDPEICAVSPTFTISNVTSIQNGDVYWIWGDCRIAWQSQTSIYPKVRIEAKKKDGTWVVLPGADTLVNTGSFIWRPTGYIWPFDRSKNFDPTENGRIRITPLDTSNNPVSGGGVWPSAAFRLRETNPLLRVFK